MSRKIAAIGALWRSPVSSSASLSLLREQRATLLAQIASVEKLRPGSLVERYRKRGKPICHCAREDERGHGFFPRDQALHIGNGSLSEEVCVWSAQLARW